MGRLKDTVPQTLAKHGSGSARMQRASPVDGMQLVDEGGEASDSEKGLVQLVTFHLDNEEYGLPIADVREINRVTEITTMPNSPEHVVGVVNLRGRTVPVIDLKRRLRLGTTSVGEESRVVVVEYGAKVLGLMVDRVAQVLRLPSEQIDAAPEQTGRLEESFTRGVGKMNDRMVIILDLGRIIGSQQQTHSAGRPAGGA
jgi:purine-binding chemotaxis protein CheW